jgi:hypothetical protein
MEPNLKLVEDLARRCVAELEQREGVPFMVVLHLGAVIPLIANLQVALRHPLNPEATAAIARAMIDGLIRQLREANCPAHAELALLGNNPEYDQPI